MEFIKIYIIIQVIFLLLQSGRYHKLNFLRFLTLEWFQYCELVFGSVFIILFFGIFGTILTLDNSLLNNSCLFASLYSIWFYITKKISNSINSDNNGVIKY